MDQNAPTPSKPQSKDVYMPLLVSVTLMTCFFIVLLVYHFLIVKYMRWWRRDSVPPPHTVAGTSVSGIEQKLLDSIPIVIYSVQNRCTFCLDHTECAVCLGELEEVDKVRILPGCKHVFHVPCIDRWLKRHISCPLCRSPVSAPMTAVTVIEFPAEVSGEVDVVGEDSDSRLTMGRTRVSMIRHCASMVFGRERTDKGLLEKNLKRSMSMDHFVLNTNAERSSFGLV